MDLSVGDQYSMGPIAVFSQVWLRMARPMLVPLSACLKASFTCIPGVMAVRSDAQDESVGGSEPLAESADSSAARVVSLAALNVEAEGF